jgi:hypothetical protein
MTGGSTGLKKTWPFDRCPLTTGYASIKSS